MSRPIPIQRFCTANGTLYGPHNFVDDYSVTPLDAFVDLDLLEQKYFVLTAFKVFISEPAVTPVLNAWGSGAALEIAFPGIDFWTENDSVRLNIFDDGMISYNFFNRIFLPDFDSEEQDDERFADVQTHGIDFASRGGGYPVPVGNGGKVGVTLQTDFTSITGLTEQHFLVQGFATDSPEQWTIAHTAKSHRPIISDLGAAPPPTGDKYSASLNGTDEYYRKNLGQWNIFNTWSIPMWVKPAALPGVGYVLIDLRSNSNNANRILVSLDNFGALRIHAYHNGIVGSQRKSYRWDNIWGGTFTSSWKSLIPVWDSTNLKLYIDGVLTVESAREVDFAIIMGGGTRNFGYGINYAGSGGHFNGNLGHVAMLNIDVDQDDVDQIWNDKQAIDLSVNSGTYDKGVTNCLHYWRPGFGGPGTDEGFIDEGNHGTLNDLVDSVNITSADIVLDAP